MKMSLKNQMHLSNIGRRTGKNVLEGKIVSRKSNGLENFDDYWTDTESVLSDQTVANFELTLSSTNVSDQDGDTTSSIRSHRKKTANEKREEFHNYSYKSSKQFLKNYNVMLPKNREIDIIGRSNKIQPSCLLNEKGSSHSRNVAYLKNDESCLYDSEKLSSIQSSSKDLSNASANKMGDLPLSTDNANSKNISSYKMNPGIKSKINNDSNTYEERFLPSNEKSYALSYSKETQGKELDTPHNMRNSSRRKSQILLKASSLANNTGKVIKRNSEVKSSQGVVFDHTEKTFLRNNRTLNNSERENAIKLNMQNSSTAKSPVATKRNMKALDTLKDKSSKFIDIEKSSDKGNGRPSLGNRSIPSATELKFVNESDSSLSEGEISPVEEKTSKIPFSLTETEGEEIHPIFQTRNSSVRQCPQVSSDSSSIEEVEILPSEEKANKISPSFKETRGEKIPPVYHTRNSSKRQSLQVLCDTSSVSNYRKRVSRRNSGVASNQAEMPNQRKKIYLRNNTTAKKSERGSSKKLNLQKSDVAKSFFETNRKRDASNTLRYSPHNFPFIKCTIDKGNKQNSHRRSTQSVVLSSEELSEEEITLSESNSGSEISSSEKEETENSSFIEKSPRISEYNMIQVNDSPTSRVKTAKPMHSGEHKNFLSETKKDDLHKKEATSCQVRRSTRTRFPPLASWRNERLKFMKVGSDDIVCLGIDKGLPEDDYAYRYLTKKLARKKIQKPKASYKNGTSHIKKTTISLVTTEEKVQLQLHHPFITCEWIKPDIESGNFSLCRLFSSGLVSFGFIDIPAHSMKEEQYSLLDNVHFLVVQGTVDAVIASTSFTFRKWDSFIVPVGVVYSLSNKGSSKALLNYCAFKFPFFNYQNI